jgi:hypothetical protein
MKQRKQYHGKSGIKSLKKIHKYFPKITSIEDASKPVVVEVTPNDVATSNVRDPAMCAFAKACYNKFNADGVIIGLSTSYVIIGERAIRYRNTQGLIREIVSFDRKAGFEAGTYMISPHSPASRLGLYKGRETHPRSNGKDRRQFKHFTTNVRVLGVD